MASFALGFNENRTHLTLSFILVRPQHLLQTCKVENFGRRLVGVPRCLVLSLVTEPPPSATDDARRQQPPLHVGPATYDARLTYDER